MEREPPPTALERDLPATADVVIVGAGVIGLAAANALRERGARVCVLEAARPGAGQSHGRARLLRHHHETQSLIRGCADARLRWDAWEQTSGRRLLGTEGVVIAARELGCVERDLTDAGVAVQVLEEAGARLPLLTPAAARSGSFVLDVRGGSIRARRTIDWLLERVGDLVVEASAIAFRPSPDAVAVHTMRGVVRAARALVCAGRSSERLVRPIGVRLPVSYGCHVRLTFQMRDPDAHAGRCCGWIDRRERFGRMVYGVPIGGTGRFALGVGGPDSDVPIDPEGATLDAEQAAELQRRQGQLSEYVGAALPALDPAPVEARVCVTTVVPGGPDHFGAWLDDSGRVIALAGNNLFKFAPLLGDLLADAAVTGEVPTLLRPPDREAASGPDR